MARTTKAACNRFQDTIDVLQHIVVPKSDDAEPHSIQIGRSRRIAALPRCVLSTIDFDDETSFLA
jgi:hypothetical protein